MRKKIVNILRKIAMVTHNHKEGERWPKLYMFFIWLLYPIEYIVNGYYKNFNPNPWDDTVTLYGITLTMHTLNMLKDGYEFEKGNFIWDQKDGAIFKPDPKGKYIIIRKPL